MRASASTRTSPAVRRTRVIETLPAATGRPSDAPVPTDAPDRSASFAVVPRSRCTARAAQACVAVGNYLGTSGSGGQFGLLDTERRRHVERPSDTTASGAATNQAGLARRSVVVHDPRARAPPRAIYEVSTVGPRTLAGSCCNSPPSGSWSAEDAPLPADAATGTVRQQPAQRAFRARRCARPSVRCVSTSNALRRASRTALGTVPWTPSVAPLPSNAGTAMPDLNGVSCTFDGVCTAVGTYNDQSNGGQPLIDTVQGSTSPPPKAPQPTDTATGANSAGTLTAVSCLSAQQLRRRRSLSQQHELGSGRRRSPCLRPAVSGAPRPSHRPSRRRDRAPTPVRSSPA